jgi:hypothetical protein
MGDASWDHLCVITELTALADQVVPDVLQEPAPLLLMSELSI